MQKDKLKSEKKEILDEIFYSEESQKKLITSSNKKQQSIRAFFKKVQTPTKNNVLSQWNSKSQKKVRKKYIQANQKKEHSAVQLKPARNKSKSIAKLQKFQFKKIILKKLHKKNHEFFNLREDYFLLISEYVFAFPEFGFKNLTSFLKVVADVTKRSLKSVQRRREKLKKLSRLQIWVLENFMVRFLPRMNDRKILNLKYENINIIKTDNTDIPEDEKQFIKNLIKDYGDIELRPNELELNHRKRGRPQSEQTLDLQEKCAELDLYELYNPWIIEDLKKFLFQQKNSKQQLKLTENFPRFQKLQKKPICGTTDRSNYSDTPLVNKDISIMSLLTNSGQKPTNPDKPSTQNQSIKSFFPSIKELETRDNSNQESFEHQIETIKEEKSEFEKSKLSVFCLNKQEQLIL